MNTRAFLCFFLLVLFPIGAFSQSCDNPEDPKGTRVYYVNGMNNSPEDRREGVEALDGLMNNGSYSYGQSINNLEKGLKQLTQAFEQRIDEPTQFWEWMANLSLAPDWFKQAFADYMVSSANVAYATDIDLRLMVNQYVLDLQSGKKVILVSHSQGNFYANSAYQFVSQNFPSYANSIGQVAVATPSGRVQNGGPFRQNSVDVIISTVARYFAVLPPTFSYNSPADILNHSFIDTYLRSQGAKIRDDILNVESALEFPQKHPDCDQNAQIETAEASLITDNSAVIEGTLTAGSQVNAWLVYGTSIVYCYSSARDGVGEFTAPTSVLSSIGGLQASKTYYFRACALGPDGNLNSGSLKSFITNASPTPPPPEIPCSNQAFRGDSNGLITVFDFRLRKGVANVRFDTFNIPDSMEIYKHNSSIRLLYTPGFVSGVNTGHFTVDGSFSKVDVIVTGNSDTGTLWDLTINCPAD